MPARTLNDFFAGFFMATKSRTEVKMLIRLGKKLGKEGVKVIKVEGGREKEREIIVRRETVSSKWKGWNHGHLLHDWNKNYFVK
jgi:hypothetical protein